MKLITRLFLIALLVAGALVPVAQAATISNLNVVVDQQGRETQQVGPRTYNNEAYVTSAAASVQATCPSNANYIQFFPGTAGNFFTKPNGTGVPGAASVTDGTGWLMNLADIQPINQLVEDTTITSYAVASTVVPNKVPYTCFK